MENKNSNTLADDRCKSILIDLLYSLNEDVIKVNNALAAQAADKGSLLLLGELKAYTVILSFLNRGLSLLNLEEKYLCLTTPKLNHTVLPDDLSVSSQDKDDLLDHTHSNFSNYEAYFKYVISTFKKAAYDIKNKSDEVNEDTRLNDETKSFYSGCKLSYYSFMSSICLYIDSMSMGDDSFDKNYFGLGGINPDVEFL